MGIKETAEKLIRNVAATVDVNGDGKIEIEDLKQGITKLVNEGTAAIDANGDGKVEIEEALNALGDRAKEVGDAAIEALDEVKKGFDANEDGTVSTDEISVVAEAVAKKAKETVDGLVGKKEE